MMSRTKRSLKKTPKRAKKIPSFLIKNLRTSIRGISLLGHRATITEVFGVFLERRSNAQVLSSYRGQSHALSPQFMRSSLNIAHALPPQKDPRPTPAPLEPCTQPSTYTSERTQRLTVCPKRLQVLVCLTSISWETTATWTFGVHTRCRTALLVFHIRLQAPPVLSLIRCFHRSPTRCSTLAYLRSKCRIRTINKPLRAWSS